MIRADKSLSEGEGFGVFVKLKFKQCFGRDTGKTTVRKEEESNSGVTGD